MINSVYLAQQAVRLYDKEIKGLCEEFKDWNGFNQVIINDKEVLKKEIVNNYRLRIEIKLEEENSGVDDDILVITSEQKKIIKSVMKRLFRYPVNIHAKKAKEANHKIVLAQYSLYTWQEVGHYISDFVKKFGNGYE